MSPSFLVEPLATLAYRTPERVRITGEYRPEYAAILTLAALDFAAELHRRFNGTRRQLLARREAQVGIEAYENGHYEQAARTLDQLVRSEQFVEFLTVPACGAL